MPRFRRSIAAGWLAAAICVPVLALTWFGYRAILGWQRSSLLLTERRTSDAADQLVTALLRDMHAAQRSVLSSADWTPFMQDPPYDVGNIVAGAFARYPYPETFFAARDDLAPSALLFFTRSDRPPPWASREHVANRFPVTVLSHPELAERILNRIFRDAAMGRQFAIFEAPMADATYQVVAHLRYGGQFREHLDGVFGFMVNLDWARQNYFQELTKQVARIGGMNNGLALAVLDEHGGRVAGVQPGPSNGLTSRRSFPLLFFDPLLVAVAQPPDLQQRVWSVEVSGAADVTFVDAIRSANRTLVVAAVAAISLAFGLMLTARAVSARDRLSALRSEFVSSVTHELKTPIAAIRAAGDTLVSGRVPTKEGQREYAQLVVQESRRLTRLIDNLLALSRITDLTEVYWFEPLAVDSLVDKTLEGFAPQMTAVGFETHVDIPADLPPILGDRTAIGLMLDNLIDNAIRYSPTRRTLSINASSNNGHVVLRVADAGQGIPTDEIGQVTKKFYRGRQMATLGGSGLGLAIVKRIVADHRGDLSITSEVDVGTTVSVTLPAAIAHEEANPRR